MVSLRCSCIFLVLVLAIVLSTAASAQCYNDAMCDRDCRPIEDLYVVPVRGNCEALPQQRRTICNCRIGCSRAYTWTGSRCEARSSGDPRKLHPRDGQEMRQCDFKSKGGCRTNSGASGAGENTNGGGLNGFNESRGFSSFANNKVMLSIVLALGLAASHAFLGF